MARSATSVAVVMMHSAAPLEALRPYAWLQDLTTPPDLLEETFRRWQRKGYHTASLEEVADFLDGKRSLPRNSLALTFDDGYLDNWVGLEPLLARYGFRATVFMSTDFVDPRPVVRPQMGNGGPVEWRGYLSWGEMRRMEAGGHLDIQSHARTHTWYFVAPRIVDFYRPEVALTGKTSMLRFLWLNTHTERKPFALSEMKDDSIPWGTPVYDYRPAIPAKRFFPLPEETDALVEHVAGGGGASFFDRSDWRQELDALVERFRAGRPAAGEYESDDAREERIRDELDGSRRLLSENLAKQVPFLSFPQGGMDDVAERIAGELGFRRWTVSAWKYRRKNIPGVSPVHFYRCGTGYRLLGENVSRSWQLYTQDVLLRRHFGYRLNEIPLGAITLADMGRRWLARRR